MDHRCQQRRSSYGGELGRKTMGASKDPDSFHRADLDGNDQVRRRSSSLDTVSHSSGSGSTEKNSFICESRQSSSRKAYRSPTKASISDEMSSEKDKRRTSPSVIASLMGLDSMPPAQVQDKQRKEIRSYSQSKTYTNDNSFQMMKREKEAKDVLEKKYSMTVEKQKTQPLCKRTPYSKRDDNEVAFIKRKFLEAKCLSTDETLHNSKEFNDALDILDSNKDLLLQFLQEPNSFAYNLSDWNSVSPSPHESRATQTSKGISHDIENRSSNSETKAESCTYLNKDVLGSSRKHVSNSLKEHSGSLAHKLLRSRTTNTTRRSTCPTRIVVSNPNLEKEQNWASSGLHMRPHKDHQYDFRRPKEFRQSEVQVLHTEGRDWQKLFDDVEAPGYKPHGSGEIDQEIRMEMKCSARNIGKVQNSESNEYIKDNSLCAMSARYKLHNFEECRWTPSLDYRNLCSSPSSSSSSESTVSKEARKRLSKRWRMTRRFHNTGLVSKSSSTLSEMLDLSDVDTSRASLISEKISDEKLARGLLGTRCYPSGISSSDGWSKSLSRSYSIPPSNRVSNSKLHTGDTDSCYMLKDVLNLGANDSLPRKSNKMESSSRRIPRPRMYKSQSLNFGGEENKLPVKEIHINHEVLKNKSSSTNHYSKEASFTNSSPVNQDKSFIEPMGAKVSSADEKHFLQGRRDEKFSANGHIYAEKTLEEILSDNPQLYGPWNPYDDKNHESHKISDEAGQPSPLSVLELPYEDMSSQKSFEMVDTDLQGLRMQLHLLESEKSETYDKEDEYSVPCEEDTEHSPGALQIFKNNEERDFSYLLDVLVDSGVHGAKQDQLIDACYSPEQPVHPGIFEKLEKKYEAIKEWSRSERKIFFDIINSVLSEILAPFLDLHPWVNPKKVYLVWGHDRFSEEVWHMVARQRKELGVNNSEAKILDPKWLVFGDDVDTVGREIECMVKDDLIDELVSDLIFINSRQK